MAGQGNTKQGIPIWKTELMPQEEMLELGKKKEKLIIGIPKENHEFENRVALTPEAVELLVENGHDVYIENEAGKGANYSNTNYSERGGFIVDTSKEIMQCDVILKIAPLTPDEIEMLRGDQLIISSLFFGKNLKQYFLKLMEKKVTAISFEKIRDENDTYPVVRTISEIAGKTAVLVAAEYMSISQKGKGVMLGGLTGITPTEVVILGAGYAAESAVRAALGLGAMVKVFDSSIPRLRQLEEKFGSNLYTSIYHPQVIKKAFKSAEVVIAAMHLVDNNPKFIVTEDMVKTMKKGTVIVDISIDQGICVETSESRTLKSPTFIKNGVVHYCVPNISSRVSRTASIALSNIFAPILLEMGDFGSSKLFLKENRGLRNGIYIYKGLLTNSYIGNYFDIPFKDIDLLMAAF